MFYTVEYYTYMVSQGSKLIVSLSSALYMQVPLKNQNRVHNQAPPIRYHLELGICL